MEKTEKRRVVIEVSGGVAYVESCPDDIEVFIKDYDDADSEDGYLATPVKRETSLMEDMANFKKLLDEQEELKK